LGNSARAQRASDVRPVHWTAGARGHAGVSVSWAGLPCGCGPKVGRRPTQAKKEFFFLFFNSFSRFSKGSSFKSIFEQQNDIFWKWPKNKSYLEFNSLQLLLRDQLKNLNRF
jgi:hypothetical protein